MNHIDILFDWLDAHWLLISIIFLIAVSIDLMFYWEGKVRWWLRLPIINLFIFVILLIGGFIEEIYLTFHPEKRTKYIKSSIFQLFF